MTLWKPSKDDLREVVDALRHLLKSARADDHRAHRGAAHVVPWEAERYWSAARAAEAAKEAVEAIKAAYDIEREATRLLDDASPDALAAARKAARSLSTAYDAACDAYSATTEDAAFWCLVVFGAALVRHDADDAGESIDSAIAAAATGASAAARRKIERTLGKADEALSAKHWDQALDRVREAASMYVHDPAGKKVLDSLAERAVRKQRLMGELHKKHGHAVYCNTVDMLHTKDPAASWNAIKRRAAVHLQVHPDTIKKHIPRKPW